MIFLPAGVITKRDFSEKDHDQWLMSYNAITFTKSQREIFHRNCLYNISKSDDERRACKKYSISSGRGLAMDIPPDFDDFKLFASYGPKVNHKFYDSSTYYKRVEHPR